MSWKDYIPFMGSNAEETLITGLHGVLGDGDAIALLPYDDGTIYPKRAYFDKELIGGIGGFETDDGDKIVVDGSGEAVRQLFGVPIVLGVDPTEHAAAVDPIKSLIAHKNNIGEWIRVDKKGNVIEAGEAVEALDPDIISDGGMVKEFAEANDMAFDAAMATLAQRGEVSKIYDIAPPAAIDVTDEGEVQLDEATHIAVDQSKAADLMPTTIDTVELNTALDKARMEEHEEGKLLKYIVYGVMIGAILVAVTGIVMFLLYAGVGGM